MLEKVFRNFEEADSPDTDRFVSILISKPGLGKSATISKMAQRMNYSLVDLNLASIEPIDLLGLGAREKIDGKWQTMVALPTWVDTALRGNCILFVDEFNNCGQDVLSAFQKLFSDFVIDGRRLPRTTHIVGACNPPGRDAIYAAKRLSGAFRRRLCMLPVVDDFEYVMNKHRFQMPRGFHQVDYEDIQNYCEYDEISSAVVDNVFNIISYSGLTDFEKVVLINGFGEKALGLAKELGLFPPSIFASGRSMDNLNISYGEWKKNPNDEISEFQQILWGQESIHNSHSYSRSKSFVSKVHNPSVYVALYDVLKNKFVAEYELDERKLPQTRDAAATLSGLNGTITPDAMSVPVGTPTGA
jgi:hypothetical protein